MFAGVNRYNKKNEGQVQVQRVTSLLPKWQTPTRFVMLVDKNGEEKLLVAQKECERQVSFAQKGRSYDISFNGSILKENEKNTKGFPNSFQLLTQYNLPVFRPSQANMSPQVPYNFMDFALAKQLDKGTIVDVLARIYSVTAATQRGGIALREIVLQFDTHLIDVDVLGDLTVT